MNAILKSFMVAAALTITVQAASKPKLPEVLNIAYSSQDDGCHINTIEHFKAAVEAGFNCLKTDMQRTSDGVVVLCHDAGFTIDGDGRIGKFDKKNNTPIPEMSFKDIRKLEYASGKAEKGGFPKVCTLEEFVAFCREAGVWMYITQRNNKDIDATQAELKRILKKYRMEKKCIVNNYPANTGTCRKIHEYLPKVPVCFTMTPESPLTKEKVNEIARLAPVLICLNTRNIPTLEPEVAAYAASKGIKLLGWFPKTAGEYSDWKARGLTGAQITKRDVIQP